MTTTQAVLLVLVFVAGTLSRANAGTTGLSSIDTGHTITKVRTAAIPYIVASSYEGAFLGVSYGGKVGWKNELSGLMNRDLWCDDLDSDGTDEILAADADGKVYCLDGTGKLLWKFKANDAPINAFCVVTHGNTRYVVCGSYDKNIYYLSAAGKLVKTIPSAGYSKKKSWGNLYELIAKGALYVPKRDEIVSFNPVHLSMMEPDKHYLDEGNNAKWLTFYDEEFENNNPMVFSRLNGTWPGAAVTEWDFSRCAAGVKDRRPHFLPPYENGLVLITPPQNGAFAAKNPPRGEMKDHLHPMYRNTLKKYVTDGRQYYSADGSETYAADEYYRTVEADIKNNAQLLPVTVSGDVAWVAAQTSPTHLRLTLIDSGYLNPSAKTARVSFHSVQPARMADVLFGNAFDISEPASVKVDVPCGLFRFIDIELKETL